MTEFHQIPGPPALPFLGNVRDIDLKNSIRSFMELADTYGPIFKLNLGGDDRLFISSHALVDEVCARGFVKQPIGSIARMRQVVNDGLVTAYQGEEMWSIAHRTLVPAFGPASIQDMFPEMHDIASQLALKWARFGPKRPIQVSADFTRLTLDTIALCAMDTRLNSFYSEDLHPFVDAMVGLLAEAGLRSSRPDWYTWLMRSANKKFDENAAYVHKVAAEVVANRRANPSDKDDLVHTMLNGRDPVTGKALTDENIEDNMITFLIAGHETTSGLLSFVFMFFLQQPDVYAKVQAEVDTVIGTGAVQARHLNMLPYIKACLREALRLHPTAPVIAMRPKADDSSVPVIIGGKWAVRHDQTVLCLLQRLHKDPTVWGDDADDFKPERMLEENFKKLPRNCWKPFGNGERACIGSDFAWQEAILTVALLAQKFNFELVDPDWTLEIAQALTLKPKNLQMYATLRPGVELVSLPGDIFEAHGVKKSTKKADADSQKTQTEDLKPMSIFYGSNMGTCTRLSNALANSAVQHGFVCTVKPLNEAIDCISSDGPVVIITASYEGQPPDNAAKFFTWLEKSPKAGDVLEGAKYAVFGCGNRDWVDTFQRIPSTIDTLFTKYGAHRLAPRGLADAADGNMSDCFETWEADHLWPSIDKAWGIAPGTGHPNSVLDVHIGKASDIRLEKPWTASVDATGSLLQQATVLEVRALTSSDTGAKYHIRLQLSEEADYDVGDYLEVLPRNTSQDVNRILAVLGLEEDSVLTIDDRRESSRLPTGTPVSAREIFGSYLELNQPVTVNQIETLKTSTEDERTRVALESLAKSELPDTTRRPSILQVLEAYPSISPPLAQLLTMLPSLRPRPYSISSSPLSSPSTCTLTWSLTTHPGSDLLAEKAPPTPGLASNYLAALKPGARISVALKPGQNSFRLPPDPSSTPIIMICAGSGLAPFRGFVQQRSEQLKAGVALAPALLFIGCRSRQDAMYADELAELEARGVVQVRYAYSREGDGPKYVQDRIWADRAEVAELRERGAKVYVCGTHAVSEGVKMTAKKIYREVALSRCGVKTEAEVDEWWVKTRSDNYAVDVF